MQKHVIMIEDDPDILESTGLMLGLEDYRFTGLTAFTSFEQLVELGADCFLLDENLPGISGHIICIILKSKPQTKHIPVVLISANPQLDYLAELGEADARIAKPFEMGQLLPVIGKVIKAGL